MAKTNHIIRLGRSRGLAWFAIVCLAFGWAHIGLHAVGGTGSGHEHFATHSDHSGHGDAHDHVSHEPGAHDVPFSLSSASDDHGRSAPPDNDQFVGDDCFLANHPPTMLCPVSFGLASARLALASPSRPDDIQAALPAYGFRIRAPPFA